MKQLYRLLIKTALVSSILVKSKSLKKGEKEENKEIKVDSINEQKNRFICGLYTDVKSGPKSANSYQC